MFPYASLAVTVKSLSSSSGGSRSPERMRADKVPGIIVMLLLPVMLDGAPVAVIVRVAARKSVALKVETPALEPVRRADSEGPGPE
jgi:hypothetical protein